MSNDLIKRTDLAAPKQERAEDAASRLKAELMQDALGRMFGEDGEKQVAPGHPRVIFALANHAHTAGWDRAKVLQREMFQAAAGSGLEMKFAFYGADNAAGVRCCQITKRWITDPDDMAGVMDRAECNCGCYVNIRDVLAQAVKENEGRPLRAVIIVGDVFHDDEDGLYEAAISANELRRAGTQVILIQQSDDPVTARKLQWLETVSGAAYFPFDLRTQERQFLEMWQAVSALRRRRRGGREDDGRASGDPAAATSQAGADANHRGARSRAGGLRHQGMTALNKWADLLEQIVSGKKPGTVGRCRSAGKRKTDRPSAAYARPGPNPSHEWTMAEAEDDNSTEWILVWDYYERRTTQLGSARLADRLVRKDLNEGRLKHRYLDGDGNLHPGSDLPKGFWDDTVVISRRILSPPTGQAYSAGSVEHVD